MMETLLIGLKNEKARQLLTDLAALDLIEIQEQNHSAPFIKLSELKNQIKGKMNEVEIDNQLENLRNEWQRSI